MPRKPVGRKKITVAHLVAALSASELYLRGVRQVLMQMDSHETVPLPLPDWEVFGGLPPMCKGTPAPVCQPEGVSPCWPTFIFPWEVHPRGTKKGPRMP
jgi:hypothetical protein